MKRFLLFAILMALPGAAIADIASTDYVDKKVPMATAETAGVVIVDDTFDILGDSTNPVQAKALLDGALGPLMVLSMNNHYQDEYWEGAKESSINPSRTCEMVEVESPKPEWGTFYTPECETVPESDRAHQTLVGIDSTGEVKPSEIIDNDSGAFVTDVSVNTDGNLVVSRADAPTPNAATRETAGIARLGEVPYVDDGVVTSAMIWIE